MVVVSDLRKILQLIIVKDTQELSVKDTEGKNLQYYDNAVIKGLYR